MIGHRWTDHNGNSWELHNPASPIFFGPGVEGMGSPEHVAFTRESARLDGQSASGWRAPAREVFWPIIVHVPDENWEWLPVQRMFWRGMRPLKFGTWRVTDTEGQHRYLRCRFVADGSPAYVYDPSLGQVELHRVEMVADDPWWTADPIVHEFQTAADEVPFYAVGSLDHVLDIMPSNTIQNATIDNPGELPAWPVFRIFGPVDSFVIGQSGFDSFDVAADIVVPEGEYLEIDTSPTKKTATLSSDGQTALNDVTDQLVNASFFAIADGGSRVIYVTLVGPGSLVVTIAPRYFRAF